MATNALIIKEVKGFFNNAIGYLVIGLFLLINGLFLWVFEGSFNIFDQGIADLLPFFELTPWIFTFLIAAITMRCFSEENKIGTLELLLTKPLSLHQIILGKFLGCFVLVVLALLPTLIYLVCLSALQIDHQYWDLGSTLGSFIGIIFLGLCFIAIGLFTSALTNNQIVAFLLAVIINFLLFFGIEGLSFIFPNINLSSIGIQYHYSSISRGVIDTKDIFYFLSIVFLFLVLTYLSLLKTK